MFPNLGPFRNFQTLIQQLTVLVRSELYRGWLLFLLPLPFWGSGVIYALCARRFPWELTAEGAWSLLGTVGLLALSYGLNGFSSEADRRTLDFLLSRPLSPYAIVGVKYLISLGVLLFWVFSASFSFHLPLAALSLPRGMGYEWLLLFILIIHAMSFLAGVVAKGLERLFVISLTAGSISWLSYHYWSKVLNLISANFYWPDVPPRLMFLLTAALPFILMIMGLAVPLAGTLWYLRSRVKWWEFKPFYWVGGAWALLYLLIAGAEFFLAPALWPLEAVQSGDWHDKSGILLDRVADPKTKFSQLYLAQPGSRPRLIHAGPDIRKPRFAPDGRRFVFVESGWLKLFDLTRKSVTVLTPGQSAAWSGDGRRILLAREVAAPQTAWNRPPKPRSNQPSQLVIFDLATRKLTPVPVKNMPIADLVWDSARNTVYLFGSKTEFYSLNLNNFALKEYQFPEQEQPSIFSVVHPTPVLDAADDMLFFGQAFDQSVKIFFFNPRRGKLGLLEEKADVRILTGPPVLIDPDATAYIWPRFDGGFERQISYFYMGKLDAAADHHD